MAIKSRAGTKLSDTIDNPGPGMFVDPRARLSADRANAELGLLFCDPNFIEAVGRELNVDHQLNELIVIASHYWADKDYDERLHFSEIKRIVRPLAKQAEILNTSLKDLPRPLTVALSEAISKKAGRSKEEHITRMLEDLADLKSSIYSILRFKIEKSRFLSVEAACDRLWVLWELISGTEFVRSWDIAISIGLYDRDLDNREFVHSSAKFVQIALQAIDPTVRVAFIRSCLKRVAAQKPKSG